MIRPPSLRSKADEVLGAQVRQSFVGSDRTYGARRVWHDVLAQGHHCGLHRIERLMRLQGLRRCTCGQFFLQRDLVEMDQTEQSDLPLPSRVSPSDLPLAITQARSHALELAARSEYWLELNHAYRDLYRVHRDAEDAATQAAWEAANPDRRNFWQRWRNSERRPQYRPSPDRPLTFPVFEASQEQRENMQALLRLMEPLGPGYDYERVELHRELGQFDEAAQALKAAKESDSPTMHMLSTELIAEGHAAPVRYRG